MRAVVLLVLLSLVLVSASRLRLSSVDLSADPQEYEYQITVGGTLRTFYMYVPVSYNTSTNAWPLMVFFHGATDACTSAANFMISGFTAVQAQRQFLLVAGCGLNKVWTGPTDLPFAEAILDEVTAAYRVDENNVYASGFSNGAGLTEYIGCRIPNRFTGLAIAAGWVMGESMSTNLTNDQLLTQCDELFAAAGKTVNVIKLQGSIDPAVVPYGRTSVVSMRDDFYGWALRNGCKGSPTTVEETKVFKDERFEDCPTDVTVRLVFLYGIPHQWVQNATFDYNNVILDNFNIGSMAVAMEGKPQTNAAAAMTPLLAPAPAAPVAGSMMDARATTPSMIPRAIRHRRVHKKLQH